MLLCYASYILPEHARRVLHAGRSAKTTDVQPHSRTKSKRHRHRLDGLQGCGNGTLSGGQGPSLGSLSAGTHEPQNHTVPRFQRFADSWYRHLPTSHLSNLVLCVALELQRLIIDDVSQFWHSPSLDPLQPVFQGLSFSAEFSPLMRPHASALGLGLRAPAT